MPEKYWKKTTDPVSMHRSNFKKIPWYDIKGQFLDIWQRLLSLNDSPHDIALGLALGIYVGFLPLMGIQMAVVLVVAIPFRKANKVAAVAGVWISNPLTVIPLYAFIYWSGAFFYRKDSIVSYTVFKDKIMNILEFSGFIDKTAAFLGLGADIFIPMCIGGSFVGVIAGFITYFVTRKFIVYYRKNQK
jgi:uncharacterized protein